jgi:AcrR family transcriptional regulator
MDRKETNTRRHIISVAAKMVADQGSDSFRIVDLADRASIGVPTVYYHFESRAQVIAEAQMENYFRMVEPLHQLLANAEIAVSQRDEAAFWVAVEDNVVRAWSSGQIDEKLGIVRLLLDVWNDPKSRVVFRQKLDVQFARWVALATEAIDLGWISKAVDPQSLVAVFWSASVGQLITSGSEYLDIAPAQVGDFYMRIMRELGRTPS